MSETRSTRTYTSTKGSGADKVTTTVIEETVTKADGSTYTSRQETVVYGENPAGAQPHSPTLTQPQSPTVTQPQSPTVTQSQSPTVTQSQSPTVTQSQIPTVAQPQSPTVAQAQIPIGAPTQTAPAQVNTV